MDVSSFILVFNRVFSLFVSFKSLHSFSTASITSSNCGSTGGSSSGIWDEGSLSVLWLEGLVSIVGVVGSVSIVGVVGSVSVVGVVGVTFNSWCDGVNFYSVRGVNINFICHGFFI